MPTSYIKSSLPSFAAQISTCSTKLVGYKDTLDITAAELESIAADALFIGWIADNLKKAEDNYHQWTALKDLVRFGRGGDITTAPEPIKLAEPPVVVPPNIQARFSGLAQRIKNHRNYTTAIGQDLDIIATKAAFDPQSGKPVIKVAFSSGGYPTLIWTKGKFQGVEIWKDSGKGFEKLDKDFNPDFTDKSPLPPSGTSTVWKYKLIYLYKDEQTGTWSDEISVTVTGEV